MRFHRLLLLPETMRASSACLYEAHQGQLASKGCLWICVWVCWGWVGGSYEKGTKGKKPPSTSLKTKDEPVQSTTNFLCICPLNNFTGQLVMPPQVYWNKLLGHELYLEVMMKPDFTLRNVLDRFLSVVCRCDHLKFALFTSSNSVMYSSHHC